jgi:pilus assembly protein CpaC
MASLAFAFHPYLALAQSPDASAQIQPKPKPKSKSHVRSAARKAHRHMASDTVADELNRREAARAAEVVRELTAATTPAAATPAPVPAIAAIVPHPAAPVAQPPVAQRPVANHDEPPTVAAIPPRASIVTASLTSGIPATSKPGVSSQPMPGAGLPDAAAGSGALPRLAQAPRPAPVPIQPPAGGTAPGSPPPVVTGGPAGAPGQAFGRSEIVSTQQPTLRLEVNKGTAIRLPGPATTVFVAAPDIADVQVKSPGMIYVFAKKPGDTVLYAVDGQDRVLLNTIVSVTSPLSRIKGALDSIHPNNGVTLDNQGETIVLGGVVRSAQVAEDARRLALQQVGGNAAKVISNIRVEAPNQVQLRVKIAEVNRNALKRVGINWQNINNIAMFGLGAVTGGFAVQTVQSIGGQASGALAFSTANNGLTAFIDFLATQNEATILAEPNLIAMSGETASFLAGGEIPVIAPQGGITNTITVTYKQVGVSLAFTPTIVGDRINLKVAPEVSQVTTTGQVSVPISSTASIIVPAIQTRRASTTVELGDGQSFAIAGLLQHTTQQDVVKFPWLGDIPVLGSLFKSDAYQRQETELVIVVTPYLVEPVDGELRTPVSGRINPTDVDRIIMQRTSHPTPPRQIAIGRERRNAGPTAGFKLD